MIFRVPVEKRDDTAVLGGKRKCYMSSWLGSCDGMFSSSRDCQVSCGRDREFRVGFIEQLRHQGVPKANRCVGRCVTTSPRSSSIADGNEFITALSELLHCVQWFMWRLRAFCGARSHMTAGVICEQAPSVCLHVWKEETGKSNKGTFKPRIHLFPCTHPSVSNSLDCNDWLAYKHQSTALVQNTFGLWSLLFSSISLHPVFQTCLDCGSLLHTRISTQLCVENTFGLWFRV